MKKQYKRFWKIVMLVILIGFQTVSCTSKKEYINSLGMRFVKIPNTSVMFSIWQTRVQDYKIYAEESNNEVNENWKNPEWKGLPVTPGEDYPVVNINRSDAQAFCQWLSEKEGRKYRLPTDVEWSIAAGLEEAGEGTPTDKSDKLDLYAWGTSWPPPNGVGNYDDYSNNAIPGYKDGYPRCSPVGSFPVNRFGLYDMSGNVWEWVEDWMDENKRDGVMRGACWGNNKDRILLSNRHRFNPEIRGSSIGFRVVLEVN